MVKETFVKGWHYATKKVPKMVKETFIKSWHYATKKVPKMIKETFVKGWHYATKVVPNYIMKKVQVGWKEIDENPPKPTATPVPEPPPTPEEVTPTGTPEPSPTGTPVPPPEDESDTKEDRSMPDWLKYGTIPPNIDPKLWEQLEGGLQRLILQEYRVIWENGEPLPEDDRNPTDTDEDLTSSAKEEMEDQPEDSADPGKYGDTEEFGTDRSLSQDGIDLVKNQELFVPWTYNDSNNPDEANCTIGYGHLIHTGECTGNHPEEVYWMGLSPEQRTVELNQLFDEEIQEYENAVIEGLDEETLSNLTQSQFDALVSYTYNKGKNLFKYIDGKPNSGVQLATYLENGEIEKACEHILNSGIYRYNSTSNEPDPILVQRRYEEVLTFLTGEYPTFGDGASIPRDDYIEFLEERYQEEIEKLEVSE
jgi:GH24 family phage-related lysozyme (muramidase)